MSTQAKPGALMEHSQIRAGRALANETEDLLSPIKENR